jgi:spore protease
MDLKKYNIRTDLAYEAVDSQQLKYSNEVINEENIFKKVKLTKTVINENVGKEIGRKPGQYYLVDIFNVDIHDTDDFRNIEDALTMVLKEVLASEGINLSSKGLVVGLGNVNVTPDSLGPLVIDNVIVTRHMFMLGEDVSEGISNVSALAPGVMGNTGIETSDIIKAVIEKIGVDYVIAIDALAASSISRVNRTIQVTNTGISPGSGVGNKRKELSKETLGIPVIAIGVPTVVDAVTITANTIDYILKYLNTKVTGGIKPSDSLVLSDKFDFKGAPLPNDEYKKEFLGEFGRLTEEQKASLIHSVLTPNGLNMMVTPKEIDIDITDLAEVISSAVDRSLHTIVN